MEANPRMYQCIGGTSPKVCLLRRVPRHNHANALSLPAQRCSGSRIDMYKIRRICIFERALPPSCAGQPAPPPFLVSGRQVPSPCSHGAQLHWAWRFRVPREETIPGRRGTHERLCHCRLLRSSTSRQSLHLV